MAMIPSSLLFRSLLLLSMAVAFQELQSQPFANTTDSAGRKQGWWQKIDSNGIRIYEGRFLNDIPQDTFLYYYPNGKRKAQVIFSDSGRITHTESWSPNGYLIAKGKHTLRQRDSLWQFFSKIDGALVSEEWYKAGQKDGLETIFYAGDGPVETITWKQGEKVGPWIQYYQNGTVKLSTHLINGERDGVFKTFYQDGTICVTGSYSNGLKTGTWTYYDTDGQVTLKEEYLNGTLQPSETP